MFYFKEAQITKINLQHNYFEGTLLFQTPSTLSPHFCGNFKELCLNKTKYILSTIMI